MGHRADTPPSTYESVDGLIVIERPIERALHFRFTEDDARTVDRIAQLTGLSIRAENRAARSQRQLGLRLGPGDWLVVSGGNDDHGLEELSGDEGREAWSAVDASDAWFAVRLQGRRSGDVIAEACGLDIRGPRFPVDATAVTRFARLRGLLHRVADDDTFDVYVERSYAGYLWAWLIDFPTS